MDDVVTGTANIHESSDLVTSNTAKESQGSNHSRSQEIWPAWKVELLRELWQQGVTARKIAAQLGITRNAVVGKRWRLGMARRCEPQQKQSAAIRRAKRNTRDREQRAERRERVKQRLVAERRPPTPPRDISMIDTKHIKSLGIPLENLRWNGTRPSNCRAIVSPDKAEITLYCGLPNWEGESYCAGHCLLFFNKFNPNNMRASR